MEPLKTGENFPTLLKLDLNREIHFVEADHVLHLQNSGGIPLDVTITIPDNFSYGEYIPVIAQLRPAVHRIKSLTINAPFSDAWQKVVSGIGEGQPAPLLERLVLKVKRDSNDPRNNLPFNALSTALTPSPNLIHLQFPAWPLPASPPPQLSTITSLTFDTPFTPINVSALFPFIQAVPRLKHFTFNSVDITEHADPDYLGKNVISLPHLCSASFSAPGYGFSYLGNFLAPLLTDLRLDGYRDFISKSLWDADDWGLILTGQESDTMKHLSVRTPNIRRLELIYIHFEHPTTEWGRLLSGQTLPVLEELILERTNISNTALIRSDREHSSLKKLRLCDCKYISVKGLRSYIQGRVDSEFVLSVERCSAISQEEVKGLSKIVHVEWK